MDRQTIIDALKENFEGNPSVHAFWLEGADAHDRVDQYSDIDIWLDVSDGKEDEILDEVEKNLTSLASLDFAYEKDHAHPKIRQKFFHLHGTPEYLIIDVCLQSHSREFWYTKGHADEKVKVVFDKERVIQFRELDGEKFTRELQQRVEELKKTYHFFQAWVKKELHRSNFLEAFYYYQQWSIEPLVELLRVQHQPTKKDFYLKHISLDLPKAIVDRLERLVQVNSLEDLRQKSQQANALFEETMEKLKKG